MKNVTGSRGAGPIWHEFMEKALADQPRTQFPRPAGIEEIEISADAGSLPSAASPPDQRRTEIFATGQGPLGPEHDFHQFVRIDVTTNALATEYCPSSALEERYFYVLPGEDGQKWAREHNIPQPPTELCPVHTGQAQVALLQPLPGETVAGEVFVVGHANMANFDHYMVEYGEGQDPIGWGWVAGPVYEPVDSGLLAVWDVSSLADRDYALRVVVFDPLGNGFEARTWVVVQNPVLTQTPLPTITPLPTWTLVPTATATIAPTLTPVPTDTPWPTGTPVPTALPTGLPTITLPTITIPTITLPTITVLLPTSTASVSTTVPTEDNP
jgi:hypothetical protein